MSKKGERSVVGGRRGKKGGLIKGLLEIARCSERIITDNQQISMGEDET